jgi:hypothetical protein
MRSLRGLLSTSMVLLFTALPAVTHATPEFPGLIQTDLNLDYDLNTMPPTNCIICHQTNAGGEGTLIAFGQAMKEMGGLMPYADATVQPALDKLQQLGTDSDCNGIPDIKQLEMGYNPNFPGEYIGGNSTSANLDGPDGGCNADGGTDGAQPAYGCGAQLAPTAPSSEGSVAAGLVAAIGLALARRPRRR